MIVNSTVTFGFLVEGDFSFGQFDEDLIKTLNTFERDIKRKANKLAVARNMHNYTATQLGQNDQYMHVEDVTCIAKGKIRKRKYYQTSSVGVIE